jgi:hypothetical protein
MGARRQRSSWSLIWGRWLQGHQPVHGEDRVAGGHDGPVDPGRRDCSQTRTARTPRVSPRSSARVRSGRCAARRTPATGRGLRSGVDRLARGFGEQVRPGPRHHLDQVIPAAAGQQPAPAGQPTQDAHTIAPTESPSPRSSPNRSQTSANRHELRRRPPCSAGPLPLSGLLGLPRGRLRQAWR